MRRPLKSTPTAPQHSEWLRLPGLFHRRELEHAVVPTRAGEVGEDWHVEDAGHDEHGLALYAVYHRPHTEEEPR